MSLGECQKKHTHRQYRTWMYWLDNIYVNHPGLIEHYLMAIVVEIRRLFSSKPNSIQLSDAKLKFKVVKAEPKLEPKLSVGEMAKRLWMGMLGQSKQYKEDQKRKAQEEDHNV